MFLYSVLIVPDLPFLNPGMMYFLYNIFKEKFRIFQSRGNIALKITLHKIIVTFLPKSNLLKHATSGKYVTQLLKGADIL
jgi:hypothetical protein